MNILPRISSAVSEPWVGWIMLFLLLCIALIYSREMVYVKNLFHRYMSQMKRSFGDMSLTMGSVIAMNIYKIGILAMAMYLCVKTTGAISFVEYLMVVAVILGIWGAKRLIIRGLSFVFGWKRSMLMPMEAYNGLWLLMCLFLYPILLILIYFAVPLVLQICMGGMMMAYIVLLTIRLLRSCLIKPISIFYILLYICTIELLPIGCALLGVRHLVGMN